MERVLKRDALEEAMTSKGLTQSSVARALGVTRAAVSKWMAGQSFPRPPELLRLGKLVGLGYADLVERSGGVSTDEPLVAFRRRAATKTTDRHLAHAREMGRMLQPLVPHLPFDRLLSPARLQSPSLDYDYVQRVAGAIREELKVDASSRIEFEQLIGKFGDLQAVIVPVMWGLKQRHENALHVYLPGSQTTWIYLNLDSHLHDFKFWMAHELGHVLGVRLLTQGQFDIAEDFSDAFAGALLFPEPAAEKAYEQYANKKSDGGRLDLILSNAEAYVISPYSVYREIEKYVRARMPEERMAEIPDKALYSSLTRFNQSFPSVSEQLFDGKEPTAEEFIQVCGEFFQTPAFEALKRYALSGSATPQFISRILDVPLADAKAVSAALA